MNISKLFYRGPVLYHLQTLTSRIGPVRSKMIAQGQHHMHLMLHATHNLAQGQDQALEVTAGRDLGAGKKNCQGMYYGNRKALPVLGFIAN